VTEGKGLPDKEERKLKSRKEREVRAPALSAPAQGWNKSQRGGTERSTHGGGGRVGGGGGGRGGGLAE